MKAIHHPACNTILRRPEGTTEEECHDLPIMRGESDGIPNVTSFWEPSAEELTDLTNGGNIMLTIWGHTHPPLNIQVTKPI